jgi:hypothetical protein
MKLFRLATITVLLLSVSCNIKKQYTPQELLQKAGKDPSMNAGKGKFNIDPPAGWQRMDTVMNGVAVTFLLGPVVPTEFRLNMNVVSESMQGNPLDTYFDKMSAPMSKYMQNFSAGSIGEKDIDGIHAKWMQYSHKQSGLDIAGLVYVIPKDGIAYVISCTAPKGQLEKYQAKFDEGIRSFHIL